MARISTYVTDSNITGGDMLIGTDVDNSNATKNFTVSDLAAYMATNLTNFVPYTGATGNVNLGSNSIIVGNDVIVGDAVSIGGNLSVVTGTTLLGGTLGVSGTTNLNNTNINGDIDFNGLFLISGSEGAAGELLTSLGAGNAPIWTNPFASYVPYIGASTDLNLGVHQLSATGVDVKTGPLFVNGSAGTINQILVSQGAGTNPVWSNNAAVSMPVFSGLSAQGTTSATTSNLNQGINIFSTVTLTDFCTKLPNVASGISVKIINNGVTNLRVFPYDPADSINGLPAGAYAIVPNDNKLYEFISL